MCALANDPASTIRDHFLADHRRLEDLFDQVLRAFEDGVQQALSELWTRFEEELERHMDAEERILIPAFVHDNADEAMALLLDHRSIRAQLADLGIGVDLHIVRLTAAAKLVDHLREHARREDKLLYQWRDQHLEARDRAALLLALGRRAVRATAVRLAFSN